MTVLADQHNVTRFLNAAQAPNRCCRWRNALQRQGTSRSRSGSRCGLLPICSTSIRTPAHMNTHVAIRMFESRRLLAPGGGRESRSAGEGELASAMSAVHAPYRDPAPWRRATGNVTDRPIQSGKDDEGFRSSTATGVAIRQSGDDHCDGHGTLVSPVLHDTRNIWAELRITRICNFARSASSPAAIDRGKHCANGHRGFGQKVETSIQLGQGKPT